MSGGSGQRYPGPYCDKSKRDSWDRLPGKDPRTLRTTDSKDKGYV